MKATIYKTAPETKLAVLDNELDAISYWASKSNNKEIYNWLCDFLIKCAPEYFWWVPASSTGRFHPKSQHNECGLLNHTRSAFRVGIDLLDTNLFATYEDRDKLIVMTAILLHDTFKYSPEVEAELNKALETKKYSEYIKDFELGNSLHSHPTLAAEHIRASFQGNEIVEEIAKCVETHMGKWTKSENSEVTLKEPTSSKQKFVHLCDYIASRPDIEVSVNNKYEF